MRRVKAKAKEFTFGVYRRLPEATKDVVSKVAHGETDVQRWGAARLLEARARIFGAKGEGDVLSGTLTSARRAVQVDQFDAWGHVANLNSLTLAVLRDAGIPVYPLPNHIRPVLVVPDNRWDDAWAALADDERLLTLWLRAGGSSTPVRGLKSAPTDDSAWIYQYVVSPNGLPLASVGLRVRLLKGRLIEDEAQSLEPGSLVLPRGSNSFGAFLSPAVQAALMPVDAVEKWPRAMGEVIGDVDLVYTWVDGDDPEWLAKRQAYEVGTQSTSDANLRARFVSRDELKYSLRSVEMYASWVNKIYLVTDAQVPSWLRTDHPKLTVVDHRELFSPEDLPVFNSHAIESRLHRIPGLSEHFIYMNDDVFFGRPIRPEVFFFGNGVTKFFPSKALIDPGPPAANDAAVTSAAKNNRALIEDTFGRTFSAKLKHTPHAHLRSVLEEMEARYPEMFAACAQARFRSHGDHALLSGLAQRYGEATGRSAVGSIRYGYVDISRPSIARLLNRWLRNRSFDSFCMNETGLFEVDEESRDEIVRQFLEDYFPVASGFEITEGTNVGVDG